MGIRTGAQYLDGIRDDREVWCDGERVKDVTKDPRFAGGARTMAVAAAGLSGFLSPGDYVGEFPPLSRHNPTISITCETLVFRVILKDISPPQKTGNNHLTTCGTAITNDTQIIGLVKKRSNKLRSIIFPPTTQVPDRPMRYPPKTITPHSLYPFRTFSARLSV